jgi:hypothetical protein
MRRSERLLAATVAALAVTAASGAAQAYCRTSSCPNVGTSQVCTPALDGDCGVPLFWNRRCVGWSLQKDTSPQVSFPVMEQIVTKAFETWMKAPCGTGTPLIQVKEADPATCTRHEYNQTAGNANIIVFRDAAWPYEGSANTLALTTVTYNLDTGEIYDADMEMNSADNKFSSGDTGVEFDLLSIVTHETGHFLGLAHTTDNQATMFPDYQQHSINLRDLAADDIAGICAIYPPGGPSCTCDYTPRHGFSALCAADQTAAVTEPPDPSCVDPSNPTSSSSSGGCSVSAPRGGLPGEVFALLAAALGLGLGARRRRSGPRG